MPCIHLVATLYSLLILVLFYITDKLPRIYKDCCMHYLLFELLWVGMHTWLGKLWNTSHMPIIYGYGSIQGSCCVVLQHNAVNKISVLICCSYIAIQYILPTVTSVYLCYCICDWPTLAITSTKHIHEEEKCRKRMDKSHSTKQRISNQSEPFCWDS